jgi:hypothetical protein
MYLAHELKESFKRSRNLAEDLEKITYTNCETISDVNCDIGQSRFSVKKTFRHIFDI